MLKGLLLIAHGSPRKEANDEFLVLAEKIRERTSDLIVQHAFLDCASPDIPHAIDSLEKNGAKAITILPFFLVHGLHTSKDIPRIVDEKKKAYPALKFKILEPVGAWPEIIEMITARLLRPAGSQ